MKKTLSVILAVAMLVLASSLISCQPATEPTTEPTTEPPMEPLELKIKEINAPRNHKSYYLYGILGVEENELSNYEIKFKSSDESIVNIENNIVTTKDKCGTATIDIIIENKKEKLKINVLPSIEYLKIEAEKENAIGFIDKINYYAAQWLINNLDKFKNPESVSVDEIWYADGSVTTDNFNANYLIVGVNAQNGFGGYSFDYYKVSPYSIEETTIDRILGLGYRCNGVKVYSGGYEDRVDAAVKEYIEENY